MNRAYAKIKDCPYMVCNEGYVFSIATGHILTPSHKKSGYDEVTIHDDEGQLRYLLIHRVVADYFVSKRDGADEVNHKDGNKRNNNADNLEWVTRNENLKHAYELGLRCDDVSAKKVVATNVENGEEIEFSSIYKAARFFGISQGNICMCCKGLRPYANGFYWRYKEGE